MPKLCVGPLCRFADKLNLINIPIQLIQSRPDIVCETAPFTQGQGEGGGGLGEGEGLNLRVNIY